MNRLKLFRISLLWLCCFGPAMLGPNHRTPDGGVTGSPACYGQTADPTGTEEPVTVTIKDIDQVRKQVESSTELDDAVKAAIAGELDQAVLDVEKAKQHAASKASFQQGIESAESRMKTAKASLAQIEERKKLEEAGQLPAPTLSLPDNLASPDKVQEAVNWINKRVSDLKAEAGKEEKTAAAAAAEPAKRSARLKAIAEERPDLEESLVTDQQQLKAAIEAADGTPLNEARRLRYQAKVNATAAKLDLLRVEEKSYPITIDLVGIEGEIAKDRAAQLDREIADWERLRAKMLRSKIDTYRDRVSDAVANTSLKGSDLEKVVMGLLDIYQDWVDRGDTRKLQRATTEDLLNEVESRKGDMTERVAAVGLTEALAMQLQREKDWLTEKRKENRPDAELKSKMGSLQIATFALQDNTRDEAASVVSASSSPDQVARRDLLELKRTIERELTTQGTRLYSDLVLLDTDQRRLREAIDDYLDYIEENLLWTRNAPFIFARPPDIKSEIVELISLDTDASGNLKLSAGSTTWPVLRAVYWISLPENWAAVWRQAYQAFRRSTVLVVLYITLVLALLYGRPRWRVSMKQCAEQARRRLCVELEPTIRATMITVLMAAPVPLVLAGLGWLTRTSIENNEFVAALSYGLFASAWFVTPFILLAQVCRADGLAIDHFDWSSRICKSLRHFCRDTSTVGGALVLAIEALHVQTDNSLMDSLGRYLVIALMVLFIVELHRLLWPDANWIGRYGTDSFRYRYRRVIWACAMQVPLGVILLISFGYEYMTVSVISHFSVTFMFILVLGIVEAICIRALLVRRRRLTIAQFRQRRAEGIDGDATETTGIDVTIPESDLGTVSQQAQKLVRLLAVSIGVIGVAYIWTELLPALRMLDRVTVWPIGAEADVDTVTLRDLIYSGVIIAVTVYAVKHLPALIELFLLQQIEPGARYAVTTIARYVIGAVGAVFGLSFLNIPWSQLSWIFAAASVGLGFGLQEILANFVSGIILLLEQPIRVGDVVTVDGATGVVTKMQIRATTVTNYDRQELLIPNKDLITGKLLNWTLSSVINRVVINVGVAYGTDPGDVQEILLGVVKRHPEIMEDPGPMVTFEQFGDSSLNFVIRCYLPTLDKRLSTVHDLHTGIAKALDQAGIEIPFPQRDIRMTIEPAGQNVDSATGMPVDQAV